VKDDPDNVKALAEARFQANAAKQSFKFLLGYTVVQFLYLCAYFFAAFFHQLNYVPLVADSIMLLLHLCVALSHRCSSLQTYNLLLGVALVADALLFAISDPVVEAEANKVFHVAELFKSLGGVPELDGPSLPHPYKSNAVFQFHCLYLILFVLPFKQVAYVMPWCVFIYAVIILSSYFDFFIEYTGRLYSQDQTDVATEVLLLVLSVCFVAFAKRMLEQSQRPLFFALEHRQKELIQEKIKRCHVEFEIAGLQDILKIEQRKGERRGSSTDTISGIPVAESKSWHRAAHHCAGPQVPPSLRSITSAPAAYSEPLALQPDFDIDVQCNQTCDGPGDCLPSDAYVWIEQHAAPQRLDTVQSGQRVLCYDNLLRGFKYSDVLNASMSEAVDAAQDWVTVGLSDGTVLDMTMDHPVKCYPIEPHSAKSSRCPLPCDEGVRMKAGDIQAGEYCIMVLKTTPVSVTSVKRGSASAIPKTWVNLRVQHPDRHTIFVAQNGSQSPHQSMAVGSADYALARKGVDSSSVFVRRTFVNIAADDEDEASSQRAASAPSVLGATFQCRIKPDSEVIPSTGPSEMIPEVAPRATSSGSTKFVAAMVAGAKELSLRLKHIPARGDDTLSDDFSDQLSDGPSMSEVGRTGSNFPWSSAHSMEDFPQHQQEDLFSNADSRPKKLAGLSRRDRQRAKRRTPQRLYADAADQGEAIEDARALPSDASAP